MKLELFHAIADSASARVRRWISERDLLSATRFRNVHYPEVVVDLHQHGGSEQALPALWDGEKLFVGADAVIARLQARVVGGPGTEGDVGRG